MTVEQADPLEHLEEVVRLFADAEKPRSHEHFRWYYEDKGFGRPVSWLLRDRDSGRILGLNSVVFRRIRYDGNTLLAGLGGNLLVDPSARRSMGANQLMRVSQELVRHEKIDILLGIMPNDAGGSLARASRARAIGSWRTCIFVARSRRWLRSRLGGVGAAVASPVIDLGAKLHRAVTAGDAGARSAFEIRRLSANSFREQSFTDWHTAPGQFSAEVNPRFIWNQFGTYPGLEHEIVGLFPSGSTQLAAVLVLVRDESRDRARVRFAVSDHRFLTEAQAINYAVHGCVDRPGVWRVQALDGSDLSRELRHSGFLIVPRWASPTQVLMAFWAGGHPMATEFADPLRWSMFQGFNDV